MRSYILLGMALAAISTAAMAAETPAATEPAKQAVDGKEMNKEGKMRHKGMRMEKMWKEMDANEDGSISREESTAFGNKKFDERDANKDGKVTREEWDAFRKAKMEERKKHMDEKRENLPKDGANPPAPVDTKK